MKKFLIAAIGTEVGKTYYLTKLLHNLILNNKKVFASKPAISGWSDEYAQNDTLQIMYELGLDFTESNINLVSPWRFETAVSPNLAAEIENKSISYDAIISYSQHILEKYKELDYVFFESAGGILSPITDHKNWIDFAQDLNLPIILVTSSYLGSVTHSLATIKAIEVSGLEIAKIVLNINHVDSIDHKWTARMIKNFTGYSTDTLYYNDQIVEL